MTKWSTSGEVVKTTVPRQFSGNVEIDLCSNQCSEDTPEVGSSDETPDSAQDLCPLGEGFDDLPGMYELSQKASVSAWDSIRRDILNTVTESSAMPSDQFCTDCGDALANFRCKHCGPGIFFCVSCVQKRHKQSNVFHIPEQWKV